MPNSTLAIFLSNNGNFCTIWVPHQSNFGLTEIAIVVICTVVFIVGLAGNLSLIYHLTRRPSRRILPHLFLINLTVGDIIFLISHVPQTALSFILSQWHMGEAVCKTWHLMKLLTLGVTTFTLTALSVERYVINGLEIIVEHYYQVSRYHVVVVHHFEFAEKMVCEDLISLDLDFANVLCSSSCRELQCHPSTHSSLQLHSIL